MDKNDRPDACTDEHLRFLDEVREVGTINMFGAAKPLLDMYPEIHKREARQIVTYWMISLGRAER